MGTLKKVFILHGWTHDLSKWQDFISKLKKGGFEPVLLNIPGLTGETDRVWTLDDYAKWLSGVLENEKSPILMGHSNGGRIAIAYAIKHPNKLGQLILLNSAGIYHNELPIRLKRLLFKKVSAMGKKLTSNERLRNILYRLTGESDYQKANLQLRKTLTNLISVDLLPKLSQVDCPTLIIWGEADKITPLNDGKLMHEKIKNSKFVLIKDAGHSPQYTHTDEIILEIVKKIKNR